MSLEQVHDTGLIIILRYIRNCLRILTLTKLPSTFHVRVNEICEQRARCGRFVFSFVKSRINIYLYNML